ncbi:MAG: pentapeptide repeat-containing protein [Rhodospirillales bacterium]|nr:pentapeptide repeat-containing protein [Alphaproteobacteria bacterium]USO04059.1 MAG: pentapeptide repeat-containing protein [Rhodospirillales bacterium]
MYLLSKKTGKILFEGRFPTIRRCVEQAVYEKTDLSHVDLRGMNLRHSNLDGAKMRGACLWGALLDYADMSGGVFERCDFRAASLKETCLADSALRGADFRGAYFSKTIVADSDFSKTQFSCPSLFSLPWHEAKTLEGAIYWHKGEVPCDLSGGPVSLQGPEGQVVYLNDHILAGGTLIKRQKNNHGYI